MKSIQKNRLKDMLCFIVIFTYILGAQFILKIDNKILAYIFVLIPIIVTLYNMYEFAFKRKYKTIFLILLIDLSLIIMMVIIMTILSKPVDITSREAVTARKTLMSIINVLFTSAMLISNFLRSRRFEKGNIGEQQDEKEDYAD